MMTNLFQHNQLLRLTPPDYMHVTGITVEGHRASHRLPVVDKKCKHTELPKQHGVNEG